MIRPALLANENVPRLLIAELRRSGVQVHAVAESMPAASDRAVLAHAAAGSLWVLTFDRDYGELVFARSVAAPPAIVFIRQQPRSAQDFAPDVLALLDRPQFAQGHLVVMAARRMRRRRLPT